MYAVKLQLSRSVWALGVLIPVTICRRVPCVLPWWPTTDRSVFPFVESRQWCYFRLQQAHFRDGIGRLQRFPFRLQGCKNSERSGKGQWLCLCKLLPNSAILSALFSDNDVFYLSLHLIMSTMRKCVNMTLTCCLFSYLREHLHVYLE